MAKIDERGRQRGDDDRQPEDVEAVAHHGARSGASGSTISIRSSDRRRCGRRRG